MYCCACNSCATGCQGTRNVSVIKPLFGTASNANWYKVFIFSNAIGYLDTDEQSKVTFPNSPFLYVISARFTLIGAETTNVERQKPINFSPFFQVLNLSGKKVGLSAGTGKLCIFGHLGLVFIWSCFVSCLLLLLYYVICAPVLTEGTKKVRRSFKFNGGRQKQLPFSLFFKFESFCFAICFKMNQKKFYFQPWLRLLKPRELS